uniref:Secologanin synthase n=1 Tax=Aegilops tauschii subsp. strangulata TaxID=200361 RepID=A0A453QF77_AEGTS
MDKLKMMTETISDSAGSIMSEWKAKADKGEGEAEIELSSQFEELTADVISRTAFGGSHKEGKQVCLAQRDLQFLAFSAVYNVVQIPALGYLPTEKNLKIRKLDKEVRGILADIIKSRLTTNDQKLREEVMRECGSAVPTADMLNKLKLLNMFLLETLRLYNPVSVIQRKAGSDLEIGGIKVPQGTVLTIPIATIHRDKEVWGEDANEFKPLRFENGVTRASKHPNAFLSFSSGPRSCIGKNFAMIEAKIVIVMIIQRFSCSLSPKYVHAPMDVITLRPKFGLPMILNSLDM